MSRHLGLAAVRRGVGNKLGCAAAAFLAALVVNAPSIAHAGVAWDGGNSTQWWYDPVNWDGGLFGSTTKNDRLPPQNENNNAATDTWVTGNTVALPGGEGVIYDPSSNDPNWANVPTFAATTPFPATFGPQIIRELYIGRRIAGNSLLTVKGDLQTTTIEIGRSTGQTNGVIGEARINQLAGAVTATAAPLIIGSSDNSYAGKVNGTYDYRGGSLAVGINGTLNAVRLANGSNSTNNQTMTPTGPGGNGKLIIRNPATPGYVRFGSLTVCSFRGSVDAITSDGDPDGIANGIGTLEFHYANGGVRPIQSIGNLTINNGFQADTGGTTSARLDIQLDSPVTLNIGGTAPINLGLVDVDFDDPANISDDFVTGIVAGTGSLNTGFSSANGSTHLPEGAPVSATFGNIKYNWTISYHGEITWSDIATSTLASVTAGLGGVNKDVVMLGQSIEVLAVDSGDFNGDMQVDGDDFLLWQRGLGTGTTFGQGDANHNGTVDGTDLGIWRAKYGQPAAVGAAVGVPEPASLAMLALAGLSLAGLRRRSSLNLVGEDAKVRLSPHRSPQRA